MKYFYAERHGDHDAGLIHINALSRISRDRPERGHQLLAAAEAMGLERQPLQKPGTEIFHGVHSPRYVEFLRTLWQRWHAEIVPQFGPPDAGLTANIFPSYRTHGNYPASLVGRIGFHTHDQVAPVQQHTNDAALCWATAAASAADAVLAGEPCAYALCRPSGHHAARESMAGSCYFNNAAVAAQRLRRRYARVLLVDIDVHHGNGTQDIFYERDDVFFLSLHRDPADYVPYFWGYANETGAGAGIGSTLNVPLPPETDDAAWLAALDRALAACRDFNAGALVISAGYDAWIDDPCQGMRLTQDGFFAIGARLAALGLPTVVVQEGGYAVEAQGGCVTAFLSGFLSAK